MGQQYKPPQRKGRLQHTLIISFIPKVFCIINLSTLKYKVSAVGRTASHFIKII